MWFGMGPATHIPVMRLFEQEWPPMAYIFEYLVPRWEGLGGMTLL